MITNVVMSRPMGQFIVKQRTKDGMFNATDLVSQWNTGNPTCAKVLSHYFENKATEEYIEVIMQREGTYRNSVYVKSKARRDRGGGTWMHPMLFLDFAMWINPQFKYDVIKFVQDQMITYRKDAGDAYKELATAVKSLDSDLDMHQRMQKVSKALNYLSFGNDAKNLRNHHGTEEEQKRLVSREKYITQLITDGFVTNFAQLMNTLRKIWLRENCPL